MALHILFHIHYSSHLPYPPTLPSVLLNHQNTYSGCICITYCYNNPGGLPMCCTLPARVEAMWSKCSALLTHIMWSFLVSVAQKGASASSSGSGVFITVSCLWIVASWSSCEWDWSQEQHMSPSWWHHPLIFLGLIFRSVIYLSYFYIVCMGWIKVSIFLHVDIQLFKHNLLKRLSFLHLNAFASL